MKKLLILIILLVMASQVMAISMSRTFPQTVNQGNFIVRYNLDSNENTFWSIEETISGSCEPKSKLIGEAYMVGDQKYKETTYTATGSGTCTFSGIFTYTTATQLQQTGNLNQQIVTIGGTTCTESWNCGSWSACSNNQKTRTCTDSNNCGTTANKPATTQSCSTVGCTSDSGCNSGEICVNNQCQSNTTTSECNFFEDEKDDGTCKISIWVWILGGIVIFILIWSQRR